MSLPPNDPRHREWLQPYIQRRPPPEPSIHDVEADDIDVDESQSARDTDYDRRSMAESSVSRLRRGQARRVEHAEYINNELIGYDSQPGLWNQLTTRILPPDDTKDWLMMLEAGANANMRIHRTYQHAKLKAVDLNAPTPTVGLVFLPGNNRPTVTRLEQLNMAQDVPYQQSSLWRVNTAGSILAVYTIDQKFNIHTNDKTFDVLDRMRNDQTQLVPFGNDDVNITIDSQKVKLLNRLRREGEQLPCNLNATLIEVDASSLMKLIIHFRSLVTRAGPAANTKHDLGHLEDMMEAARYFYTRSPILFRMATRTHIIAANDIRYGINDDTIFQTMCSSESISELISVSAAYFNALDPLADVKARHNGKGTEAPSQATVRPKFLQVLVLLLSMLGRPSIEDLAGFIASTYHIQCGRIDLELLILKTIPLSSINTKLFLSSLVSAVFGNQVNNTNTDEENWKILICELAKRGYLPPASVDELGHRYQSWIPKLPADGICSSRAFGRLQHHGTEPRGFNEILPVKLGADEVDTEITVFFAHSEWPYIIFVDDYESIQRLSPGRYTVREAQTGRELILHIKSEPLNDYANEAIRHINNIIPQIELVASKVAHSSIRQWWRSGSGREKVAKIISQELPKAALITRHEVWLEGYDESYIAVAWQCDGRTISKNDMSHRMTRDGTRIRATLERFTLLTNRNFGPFDAHHRLIMQFVHAHEQKTDAERVTNRTNKRAVPDAPIRHTIYPGDDLLGFDPDVWFNYDIEYAPQQCTLLMILSQRYTVATVNWIRSGVQAQVTMIGSSQTFFVAPLRLGSEIPDNEEIRASDIVLLCGRYMVVLTPTKRNPPVKYGDQEAYEMANWLEIQKATRITGPRRGQNQEQIERSLSVIV